MARKHGSVDATVFQNAAKTLFANIRFSNVDDPVKTICVTSSVPNEGKSTVSIELARSIASSGKSVLLMECDMRRRSLASALRIHPPMVGLYAVLARQATFAEAVVNVSTNLYFVDVEPSIPNPADIISSRRFAELVEQLKARYDYVILDTPPVGTFVDAALVSALTDGTLFVVRENFTKREAISAAYAQLEKAGGKILGAVMNYCKSDVGSDSYYYDYYKNGTKRSKKTKRSGSSGPAHRAR